MPANPLLRIILSALAAVAVVGLVVSMLLVDATGQFLHDTVGELKLAGVMLVVICVNVVLGAAWLTSYARRSKD